MKNSLIAHPSWGLSLEIKELCRPLFEMFHVNYVDYARVYNDGNMLLLYSDGHYVDYFFNSEEYRQRPSSRAIDNPGFYLWQSYISSDFLTLASQTFKHAHGITVFNHIEDYKEIFNVATLPENSDILNLYLNQQSLLQQFIDYFRKKVKPLLHKIEKKPLIISQVTSAASEKIVQRPILNNYGSESKKVSEFLTQTNYFNLKINDINVSISKREAQCLYLLSLGKTAKEIGKIFRLSYRTIETYCDQLKSKTASRSRIELLSKIKPTEYKKFENLI